MAIILTWHPKRSGSEPYYSETEAAKSIMLEKINLTKTFEIVIHILIFFDQMVMNDNEINGN